MRFLLIFILLFLLFSACSYNESPLCETQNPSYQECIEPIFLQYCVQCHNQQIPSGNLSLATYNEISEAVNNGDVIDRILRDSSDPLVMPLGAPKLTENQIQLIVNWNANGTLNN
jgi:cytochrome c-type biogenesis protein CcmH/NrfF